MDITNLKNVIQQQITSASGIASLQLQNHIYGCFIIMEDIAQKTVELVDHQLVGPSYSFNIYEHFSEIGVRYGFVMDTKLILQSMPDTYRDAWLQTFKDLSTLQNVEYADSTEECLIDLIQQHIPADESYFIKALDTGSLPQSWVQKVLSLLLPEKKVEEEPAPETAVSRAITEKPITKAPVKTSSQEPQGSEALGKAGLEALGKAGLEALGKAGLEALSKAGSEALGKSKHLAYTRRRVPLSDKKYLAKTRRAIRRQ